MNFLEISPYIFGESGLTWYSVFVLMGALLTLIISNYLYKKDPVRFNQLHKGKGFKMSLPGMETPSLVLKKQYVTDNNGKAIDFANRDVKVKKKLSKSKTRRFFNFF